MDIKELQMSGLIGAFTAASLFIVKKFTTWFAFQSVQYFVLQVEEKVKKDNEERDEKNQKWQKSIEDRIEGIEERFSDIKTILEKIIERSERQSR